MSEEVRRRCSIFATRSLHFSASLAPAVHMGCFGVALRPLGTAGDPLNHPQTPSGAMHRPLHLDDSLAITNLALLTIEQPRQHFTTRLDALPFTGSPRSPSYRSSHPHLPDDSYRDGGVWALTAHAGHHQTVRRSAPAPRARCVVPGDP